MDVKTMSQIRRLLEGWQVGLIVIVVAFVTVVVAVPRPEMPEDIPYPIVDRKAIRLVSDKDASRARELAANPPSFDVRALGEALRKYGVADADGNAPVAEHELRSVRENVRAARLSGDETLLKLRAYQMSLFLEELRVYEATGVESAELRELGGGIVALAWRSGWARNATSGIHFDLEPVVREVLFRRRWNELTDLQQPPFALSVDEQRLLHAFFFSHPSSAAHAAGMSPCRAANTYLLKKVNELAAIDRDYPSALAAGILLLRLDRPREAIASLADYVERDRSGRYTLVARNALREAQERLAKATNP